jgi:hypothetical protein
MPQARDVILFYFFPFFPGFLAPDRQELVDLASVIDLMLRNEGPATVLVRMRSNLSSSISSPVVAPRGHRGFLPIKSTV